MNALEVFDGVPIPVEYASIQKYVTLGASDSGKTFMLARFAEQLAHADAYFAILDPVGKHWSLRAGADGKPDGGLQDVWVIGGAHGDVPLDPASGALIADTIVDHPGRYVIDVSQFEEDQQVYDFAAAFARRLFRRKMKDPGWPLLLMLEEAEWFLPQVPEKGQQQVKAPFGRIVRQGRNHGLGVFLVFQRSAAGDKGAISQCKVLIAKQMSHDLDIDAVDAWIKSNGTKEQRDQMIGDLASLKVWEAYVWSPSWLQVFARTKVFKRETFDSSANVKHGSQMARVELAPLDPEALGEKMKAIAEQADAQDPTKLQERVAELEAELERDQGALEDVVAADEAVRELEAEAVEMRSRIAELEREAKREVKIIRQVPAITENDLQGVWEVADELAGATAEVQRIRELVESAFSDGAVAVQERREYEDEQVAEEASAGTPTPVASTSVGAGGRHEPRSAARPASPQLPTSELSNAQRELVQAYAAFFPHAPGPEQLGIMLAKSYNAGPFRRAMTDVQVMGYVDETGRATNKARALFPLAKLPSPEDVQQRWIARLEGTKLAIFRTALEAYPNTVPPEEIGEAIGKNPNAGPIRKMMKDLAAWQLVQYDKDTGIRVSDYLISLI